MVELLNSMADSWFAYQWAMFWQVGVLVAILWGFDAAIHKWVWPQVRYALWMLVLVKLVIPPTVTSPASVTQHIPAAAEKVVSVRLHTPEAPDREELDSRDTGVAPVNIAPVPERDDASPAAFDNGMQASKRQAEMSASSLVPDGLHTVAGGATPGTEVLPQASPAGATQRGSLSWKAWAMCTWFAGVIVLTAWLAARLRGLRKQHAPSNCHAGLDPASRQYRPGPRLDGQGDSAPFEALLKAAAARLNLKRLPEVIVTDRVACPAVFGVFRPVLLMPAKKLANTDSRDMEHILLHELAHIKRGDLLVHALYMVLQIAYWFNPLLWMIRKKLQNLRELCCDATVARLLKEDTVHYRQTLLETARGLLAEPVDPGLGLLGLFENSNWLVTRLKWLEKKTWKNRPLRIATVMVLVSVMAVCVLPMANRTAQADFFIDTTQGYMRCNATVDELSRMLIDMAHTYGFHQAYAKGTTSEAGGPEYLTVQYTIPDNKKLTIEAVSEAKQPLNIRFTLENGADYTREEIMIELSRRLGMLPKALPLKLVLPGGVREAVLLPEYLGSKTVLSLKTGQFVSYDQAEASNEPYLAFNYSAGRQPQKRTAYNAPEDELGVYAGQMDLAGGGFGEDYEAAQGMWLAQSVDQFPDFKMSRMNSEVFNDVWGPSDGVFVSRHADPDWPYITAFRGDDGTHGVFEITRVQDRKIYVRFRVIGTVDSHQSPVTSEEEKLEAGSQNSEYLRAAVPVQNTWMADIKDQDVEVFSFTHGEVLRFPNLADESALLRIPEGDLFCNYDSKQQKPKVTFLRRARLGGAEQGDSSLAFTVIPMKMPYVNSVTTAEGLAFEIRIVGGDEEACLIEYRPMNEAAEKAQSKQKGIDVTGVVTNKATGRPIARAVVYDDGYDGGKRRTFTDEAGRFVLRTAREEHAIAAKAKGYNWQRKTLKTWPFANHETFNFELMQLPGGVREAVLLPEHVESQTVLSLKTGQFVSVADTKGTGEPYIMYGYTFPGGENPSEYNVHTIPQECLGVRAEKMDLAGGVMEPDPAASAGLWLAQNVEQLPAFNQRWRLEVGDNVMDGSFIVPLEGTNWPYITAFRGDDGTYGVFEITKVQDRKIFVRFRTVGSVGSHQSPVTSEGQKTEDGGQKAEAAGASEPITANTEFSAMLGNGATVKIVGISEGPGIGRAWWDPAGRSIPEPSYRAETHVGTLSEAYTCSILAHITADANAFAVFKLPGGYVGGSGQLAPNGFVLGGLTKFPLEPIGDSEKAEIGIGVAQGDWIDTGVMIENNPDAEPVIVTLIGTDTVTAEPLTDGTKTAGLSNATDLWLRPGSIDYEFRAEFQTTDGQLLHSWGMTPIQARKDKPDSILLSIENIAPTQIAGYRLLYRKIEWATFKDVALRPGVKTEQAAVTGDQSTVASEGQKTEDGGQGAEDSRQSSVFSPEGAIENASSSSETKNRAVESANKLKAFALGCILFAADNSDTLPTDLSSLKPYLQDGIFSWASANLVYLGEGNVRQFQRPDAVVLAYDKQMLNSYIQKGQARTNAAFVDGHVEMMLTPEQLEKEFGVSLPPGGKTEVEITASHELQKLKLLKEILDRTEMRYEAGLCPAEEVTQAKINLLTAESQTVQSQEKRIEILKQIVNIRAELAQRTEKMVQAGLLPQAELEQARLNLLDAQKAVADAQNTPTDQRASVTSDQSPVTGDQEASIPYNTVVERTLHTPKDHIFDVELFDFRTNSVFDVPGDLKFWDYPKWYAEHGIDVICIPSKQGPTLSGDGRISGSVGNYGGNLCKFVKTDLPMDCSAADLERAWKSSQSQEVIDHGGWDNLPARFFFKSRDGDSGILEVTAIDEIEKTITFKYKLFETDAQREISVDEKGIISRDYAHFAGTYIIEEFYRLPESEWSHLILEIENRNGDYYFGYAGKSKDVMQPVEAGLTVAEPDERFTVLFDPTDKTYHMEVHSAVDGKLLKRWNLVKLTGPNSQSVKNPPANPGVNTDVNAEGQSTNGEDPEAGTGSDTITSVSDRNSESVDDEQNWPMRSSKRWFVTVIVDEQGQLWYNDQKVNFEQLETMLRADRTPPKNTVLEFGYTEKAYQKLPVKNISELAQLDGTFVQAEALVKKMGFESLSFIGRDNPGDRRGPISFRYEDRVNFCLDRDIKIDVSDGWDLLDLDWLRFEQHGLKVTGRIQMTVRTRPKTKWEIALKLFDKEDQFIDSVFQYYENSGIFIGLPSVNREEQLFEFDNLNVDKVGKFEIEVRKYADSALLRPGVKTDADSDNRPSVSARAQNNETPLAPPGRGALMFDGVDDFLRVQASSSLRLENPFTVQMWIKPEFPETPSPDKTRNLLAKGGYVTDAPGENGNRQAHGYGFAVTLTPSEDNRVLIERITGNGGTYGWPLSMNYTPGDWMHLALKFNDKKDYYEPAPKSDLIIGSEYLIPTGYAYQGQIGELRIWNRILTHDEIAYYEKTAVTGNEPNLAACWTFEQNGGQIAYDCSLNQNDAQFGSTLNQDNTDPAWTSVNQTDKIVDSEPSAPAQSPSTPAAEPVSLERPARIFQFPDAVTKSTLFVVDSDDARKWWWPTYRPQGTAWPARGRIEVDNAGPLGLCVVANETNRTNPLSILDGLAADDLHTLVIHANVGIGGEPIVIDDDISSRSRLSGLKCLILSDVSVTDGSIAELSKMQNLERLCVISADLEDEHVAQIATMKNLRGLRVHGNLGNASVESIAGMVNLEELYASGIYLSNDSLYVISKMKNLRELALSKELHTEDGLQYLAAMDSLQKLDLMSFELSPQGAEYIARIPNLKSLSINREISDEAVEKLSRLGSLTKLTLSTRYPQRDGLSDAALHSLAKLKNLESLSVMYGQFTDDGFRQLAQLPRLKHVMIPNCSISEGAYRYLTGTLPELKEARFQNNRLPSASDEKTVLPLHLLNTLERAQVEGGDWQKPQAPASATPSKLSGQVLSMDGKAAEGAVVAYASAKRTVSLTSGGIQSVKENGKHVDGLMHTGTDGRFDCGIWPVEEFTLVVTHPDGWAMVNSQTLAANPQVVLQAWGGIRGRVAEGRAPAGTQIILTGFPNTTWLEHRIDFRAEAAADADGQFIFDQLPASWYEAGYLVVMGRSSASVTSRTPVEVQSGQVSQIRLGGEGRPVVGRFAAPRGYEGKPNFADGMRSLAMPYPRPGDYKQLTSEERQQCLQWRHYAFMIKQDGTFRIEDVTAGKYRFYVSLGDPSAGNPEGLGGYYSQTTVPAPDPNDPTTPFDLGELTLKMPEAKATSAN